MINESKDVVKAIARWSGFIGSSLTLTLAVIHSFKLHPQLSWPPNFITDVNKLTWRDRLFSFSPNTFVDAWTPFVFGIVGILCHFQKFEIPRITENFLRFWVFHVIMALFGTMGYCGGLGIVFSVPIWLCSLLSLIISLTDDGPASLNLSVDFKR